MRKKLIHIVAYSFIASFALLAAGCSSGQCISLLYGAEGSDGSLLVVEERGRCGYIDSTGKAAIELQFSDARPFYEGLAAVQLGSKWGYIDTKGETALPFQYDEAMDFHNGKAVVAEGYIEFDSNTEPGEKRKHPKYRIIDRNGNLVRETEYTWIGEYSEGLTAVGLPNGQGSAVLDENYDELWRTKGNYLIDGIYSEGLTVLSANGSEMYMDKQGNQAVPGIFYNANPFSEGLAAVMTEQNGLMGYIDRTGEMVIPAIYVTANPFREELAYVELRGGDRKVIDKTGKTVFDSLRVPSGMPAGVFGDGLCPFIEMERDTTYCGFMDTSGKRAIDSKFVRTTNFKNGIAQVVVNGGVGYIDRTGKYVWEPR